VSGPGGRKLVSGKKRNPGYGVGVRFRVGGETEIVMLVINIATLADRTE
jgi:hypothetical protein